MKTTLVALALATMLAQPAAAITFPSLTTIYVGTGVEDTGDASGLGIASVFQCSNVSGLSAQVRVLILTTNGTSLGAITLTVPHGAARTLSTHFTNQFVEDQEITPGFFVSRGTVNIESTQSGVFCQGFSVDASSTAPSGLPLRLVRVNPHPGTVE